MKMPLWKIGQIPPPGIPNFNPLGGLPYDLAKESINQEAQENQEE